MAALPRRAGLSKGVGAAGKSVARGATPRNGSLPVLPDSGVRFVAVLLRAERPVRGGAGDRPCPPRKGRRPPPPHHPLKPRRRPDVKEGLPARRGGPPLWRVAAHGLQVVRLRQAARLP